MIVDDSFSRLTTRMIVHDSFSVSCFGNHWPDSTLVPEVFFSLGATELSGEAAMASREAVRKKPLVPTDNNLTSMPTPISFD